MSRIPTIFSTLRSSGRPGLMPFVCGGYPSISSTTATIPALARAGASVIEVGIPFSDPIADGPVIAPAMHEALSQGVTTRAVMDSIREARQSPGGADVGLVAMVSVSIVQRLGVAAFVRQAKEAGFDGFIIPDAPIEESDQLADPIRDAGMTLSLLVAPTTPAERARRIVQACSGFVYVLARVGITGSGGGRQMDRAALARRIGELRSMTDLPLAVGFGIATPQDVQAVVQAGADAAIVGSALVKQMGAAGAEGAAQAAADFVHNLSAGLSQNTPATA